MQPLQNCIGPTIRIGREILCLPYAGFFLLMMIKNGQKGNKRYCPMTKGLAGACVASHTIIKRHYPNILWNPNISTDSESHGARLSGSLKTSGIKSRQNSCAQLNTILA